MSGAPPLMAYCTRMRDFTVRLGRYVYLRHGALVAGGKRYGRIFLRNVVRSPYKGRLRGFMAFLAPLIRSQINGYDDAIYDDAYS